MTTAQGFASAAPAPRLASVFGIAPGEHWPLASLAGLYFGTSIAFVFAETAAFGLFVESFGAQALPYAYLSIAALSSAVGFLFLRLSQRVSFGAGLQINLAFLIALCLLFWQGIESQLSRWFIFLMPFAFQTVANLGNIVVWHLASHTFHVRQAKRLYGLIVAAGWMGTILGGILIGSVLLLPRSADLYLVAAIVLLMCIALLRWALIRRSDRAVSAPSARPERGGTRAGIIRALRHPYTRLIFVYTALWWLGFFIVENVFFHEVEHSLDSSGALTAFLGWQRAAIGAVAVLTALYLTARVAHRFGIGPGLWLMPAAVTASVLALQIGALLQLDGSWLFWSATLARSLNVALGFSISQTMGTLLFQPLVGDARASAQTIAEGMVQPLATGLAGLVLLVFNTLLHWDAIGLSLLFLLVAAAWFWVIARLSRLYPRVMSEALRKRVLGESAVISFDEAALAQLRGSLHQQRPGPAIYALRQLEQESSGEGRRILQGELPRLLQHPSAQVRLEVLAVAQALPLDNLLPATRSRLPDESDPRVRGALIRILASLNDSESHALVMAALRSPEPDERGGAILGVLSSGGQDVGRALTALTDLANSSLPLNRIAACNILRQTERSEAIMLLAALMEDQEAAVRHAALRAAGSKTHPVLTQRLFAACDDPRAARVAESVLVSHGAQHLASIAEQLASMPRAGAAPARYLSLVRVLGHTPDVRSAAALVPLMSTPDLDLRLQVLLALSQLGHRHRSRAEIFDHGRAEVRLAAWLSGAIAEGARASNPGASSALRSALETELLASRRRLLLLLSFSLDSVAILRAQRFLEQAGGGSSPVALEIVDAQLPPHARPWILPLLSPLSPEERIRAWTSTGISISPPTLADVLAAVLSSNASPVFSPWTRMCAIHAAAYSANSSLIQNDVGHAPAHPGIAAMSAWAAKARSRQDHHQGDPKMLSIVEKVLMLKAAPLFSETPDNVLADVAALVEEIQVDAEQVIFTKGDQGDSLYIIVTGSVKVFDGDRLLNELGEGEAFGELALLDPEPRLATVIASEPANLLRLDAPDFREILDSQPEVSSAIIRVITKYLRSQLKYAREAGTRLQALESVGERGGVPAA